MKSNQILCCQFPPPCSQCPSPSHTNCAALPWICCSWANICSSTAMDSHISPLIKSVQGPSTSIDLCSKPQRTDLAEADVRLIIAGLLHWKAIYSLGSVSQHGKKRTKYLPGESHRLWKHWGRRKSKGGGKEMDSQQCLSACFPAPEPGCASRIQQFHY